MPASHSCCKAHAQRTPFFPRRWEPDRFVPSQMLYTPDRFVSNIARAVIVRGHLYVSSCPAPRTVSRV